MRDVRRVLAGGVVAAFVVGGLLVVVQSGKSQPPPEPAPPRTVPAGQTYTGAKQCGSCHLKQYLTWKKTKHAKEAFDTVPEKYRANGECMICHATGYGTPTGYKNAANANLAGTTCEACHGPGSKHDEISKKYAKVKKLSPEQEKEVRGSIYKVMPENVCVRCHLAQNHKEHPKYDKQ